MYLFTDISISTLSVERLRINLRQKFQDSKYTCSVKTWRDNQIHSENDFHFWANQFTMLTRTNVFWTLIHMARHDRWSTFFLFFPLFIYCSFCQSSRIKDPLANEGSQDGSHAFQKYALMSSLAFWRLPTFRNALYFSAWFIYLFRRLDLLVFLDRKERACFPGCHGLRTHPSSYFLTRDAYQKQGSY